MSGVTPKRLTPDSLPHPAKAPPGAGAAQVAQRRRAAPNGVWGMTLFLCGEITLFGTILATYFYLDFDNPRWPPAGITAPSVTLPLIATGALILTSLPMWWASRTAKRGERAPVLGLIALAMVIQLGYLAGQVLLFRHDLNQFRPQDTAYGSIYFTMLAVHHAHVLLGILLDGAVLAYVALQGLTNYWLTAVRGVSVFWHVVNVLAVLVVLTQLSPSL
jgi:heme/copper-type cytochrome/quinol oxidase subunit 3